ncbi:MAG: hypothetical protein QT08_C0008G0050 [archaeon GW2011_AR17]|nr:MAG: hypothetical protein QT08_C0008G0050 [archaeon GW2011_AR17]MBS3153812.1 hypothetical protein [Candidatus Woesearchaeota archaeon]HIH15162.1 hypothetical protein [Nanoarchaeota archaeon]HIH59428.1 hypothetical protein [Nanoarchaeota archaeon]HII13826.1 hypothetical protein [Nanoarchaeota archaeon]
MHIILSSLLACGEEEVHVSYPESSYSYPEAVFDKYYTFLKEKGYVAFDGNLEKIFVLCQGGPYELRLDGDGLGLRVQYVPLGYPGSVFQGILLHETIKEKWDDAVMYSFSDVNVNGLAEHYYSHSRRPIVPFLIHDAPLRLFIGKKDILATTHLEFQKRYAEELKIAFTSTSYLLSCY